MNKIKLLLKNERLSRKAIYENLLVSGLIKPNSEKFVNETIDYMIVNNLLNTSRIKAFKKRKGKIPEIFTNEQLLRLFEEVKRPKLAICMWMGFFCGLRIREICNLQLQDINLSTKIVFIRNSKNPNRTKDGYGKDRIVCIPDIAIEPIKKWIELIYGGKWFIPSMQDPNTQIRTKSIHLQYRELLDQCGLSRTDYKVEYQQINHNKKKSMGKSIYIYRFHTLRHTYASYLLEKGVPLENIQRTLGHNQIDTTLVYAKVRDSKTKNLINAAFENKNISNQNKKQLNSNPLLEELSTEYKQTNPQIILQERLAKGEIKINEYRKLLEEISK